MPNDAYGELLGRWRDARILDSCDSLLGWDQETYMPAGGAAHRAEQHALLARLVHEGRTDARIGELVEAADDDERVQDPASVEAANLREIRREFERWSKVPTSLQVERARTTSLALQAWKRARNENSFETFSPWLQKILDLRVQEAEAVGYDTEAYDALLDVYEPGETAAHLIELFAPLRDASVDLLGRIRECAHRPEAGLLEGTMPIERQSVLVSKAAEAIGFDLGGGRIDTTTHPFCSRIGPGDVRLTTRYTEREFHGAFFSVLHEAGHGMYEQGLPADAFGAPAGEAASYGVHESQSRLWENHVGRSQGFWHHFYGDLQATFPDTFAGVGRGDFYSAVNRVEPSLIRVDADEVTYDLHIFLRFDLERAMLKGDLAVADLPGAWNERFERDFGLRPPDDAQGCLQDIHWSWGSFAYFPTYTLGNLYAAQIFGAAGRDLGDLDEAFARGEFLPLRDWLRDKVYANGARYRPAELVERICGKPVGADDLIAHLNDRYGRIYGLT